MSLSALKWARQPELPFVQRLNGAVTPTIRAEGYTELVGDIVIVCQGGVPVASGVALPTVNITVFLNTAVTSRLQDASNGSEALLFVDEPGSQLAGSVPTTQLACATPLTGCTIISNGAEPPYDGSPGHPNVFQGVVQGNSVTFYGIPLSPAVNYGVGVAPNAVRVIRITNLRVNGEGIGAFTSPGSVVASISVSGSSALAITNSTPDGRLLLNSGLAYRTFASGPQQSACSTGVFCNAVLEFQENFATAFKIRSQGAAQNIPGQIYNSESGFYSPGLAASNPNLATAGLADFATRLTAQFQNVPAGAQVWVGLSSITSTGAALTATDSGPFSAVAASGMIGGFPVAQLMVSGGVASAVWEVNSVNPAAIDIAEFPVWVYFPAGVNRSIPLTVAGFFAPNPNGGAFTSAAGAAAENSTFPIPRFDSLQFSISSLSPSFATSGGPSFTLTVNGIQFNSGSVVDWNGVPLTTTFVSSTQLTAFVPASLIAVAGTANISVANADNATATSAFAIFAPAQAVSVAPSTGSGAESDVYIRLFRRQWGGGFDIGAQMDINSTLSPASACYVYTTPSSNAVYLSNDAGSGWSGPLTLGSSGTLQNSQCSINVGSLQRRNLRQHVYVAAGHHVPAGFRGSEEHIWVRIPGYGRPQFRMASARHVDRALGRTSGGFGIPLIGQWREPDIHIRIFRRQWRSGFDIGADGYQLHSVRSVRMLRIYDPH